MDANTINDSRRWIEMDRIISDNRNSPTADSITTTIKSSIDSYCSSHSSQTSYITLQLKNPGSLRFVASMMADCLTEICEEMNLNLAEEDGGITIQPIVTVMIPGNHPYSFSGYNTFTDIYALVYSMAKGCYVKGPFMGYPGCHANFCKQLLMQSPFFYPLCRCTTVVDLWDPMDIGEPPNEAHPTNVATVHKLALKKLARNVIILSDPTRHMYGFQRRQERQNLMPRSRLSNRHRELEELSVKAQAVTIENLYITIMHAHQFLPRASSVQNTPFFPGDISNHPVLY